MNFNFTSFSFNDMIDHKLIDGRTSSKWFNDETSDDP